MLLRVIVVLLVAITIPGILEPEDFTTLPRTVFPVPFVRDITKTPNADATVMLLDVMFVLLLLIVPIPTGAYGKE